VSARIRAGSRFKRFLSFVLIDVRCFSVHPPRARSLRTSEVVTGTALSFRCDYLIKYYTITVYGGVDVKIHVF
jgi:hypothetical protein